MTFNFFSFFQKIRDVFKPSPDWGPGCPEARQQLLASYANLRLADSKSGIDNPALEHNYQVT